MNKASAVSLVAFNHLFWLFAILSILCFGLGLFLETPALTLVPIGIIFSIFAIQSPRNLLYLFFFLLPFSIEIDLPGGFSTDLPSEPLMIVLTGISTLLIIKNIKALPKAFFVHPISMLIVLHLFWILFTSIFSEHPFISFKFFLAKLWYVIPFYFLPSIIIKEEKQFRKIFIAFGIGTFIALTYVLTRHASMGFTFAASYDMVRPIFRNHVNYAVMLLLFLPYYLYLASRNRTKSILKLSLLLLLVTAIYFSFTRAAQVSVILIIPLYFMLKLKLSKYAVVGSFTVAVLVLTSILSNNEYLNHAPDYERAIEHKKFDNLMEATTKLEDISTVERLYRWIAGVGMVKAHPFLGSGPSTFFSEYDAYTVTSFKTYVSDNPERSGIHNYYLMIAVEQGLIGLLIWLLLLISAILFGERTIRHVTDKASRNLLYAAIITIILCGIVIIINDLIEADKVGPLFFISLSIICYYSSQLNKKLD